MNEDSKKVWIAVMTRYYNVLYWLDAAILIFVYSGLYIKTTYMYMQNSRKENMFSILYLSKGMEIRIHFYCSV